jgi:hypothetical protein
MPKLKAHVDAVTAACFAQAVQADNLEEVRALLKVRPELVMDAGKGRAPATPCGLQPIATPSG